MTGVAKATPSPASTAAKSHEGNADLTTDSGISVKVATPRKPPPSQRKARGDLSTPKVDTMETASARDGLAGDDTVRGTEGRPTAPTYAAIATGEAKSPPREEGTRLRIRQGSSLSRGPGRKKMASREAVPVAPIGTAGIPKEPPTLWTDARGEQSPSGQTSSPAEDP